MIPSGGESEFIGGRAARLFYREPLRLPTYGGFIVKLPHGILAMLVTPFTGDFKLNEEALRRQVRWALEHGAEGIVATPSIGEFLHLSHLGTTKVTASVATGIDMGPARPPYMAPDNAAALINRRLSQLLEML